MGIIKPFLRISSIVLILSTTYVSQARPAKEPHQDFIDEHNKARAEVGVGPMKWNETVVAYAQKYADSKIETCEMVHSQGPYGKNLAEGWGSEMTGGQAAKFWVTEKPDYDYDSNSCTAGKVCRHYAQVVWHNSTRVGYARAKCKNGMIFVICSYDPPGNWIGERPGNWIVHMKGHE